MFVRFRPRRPVMTGVLVPLTLLAFLTGGQPAAAATTITGVEMVHMVSALDSRSSKSAAAFCPPNKRVIGGGGGVSVPWSGDDPSPRTPALTELRPTRLYDGVRDAYVVTGVETGPGTSRDWYVDARAMCADPVLGLRIVPGFSESSSNAMRVAAARCPVGGRVIGTGGRISSAVDVAGVSGRVVLQAARPSNAGDIAHVQAHEVPAGYAGDWSATAYAICVPTAPAGYDVMVFTEVVWQSSNDTRVMSGSCPFGKRLLSPGAAISNTAPGNVSLQSVLLHPGQVWARAVENTPTSQYWGEVIDATAVCVF
jgi:hypothetical protein